MELNFIIISFEWLIYSYLWDCTFWDIKIKSQSFFKKVLAFQLGSYLISSSKLGKNNDNNSNTSRHLVSTYVSYTVLSI